MTESQTLAKVLDALSRSPHGLFWRNNSGKLQDVRGRWVSFGLGLGSPDIVGILKPSGRFIGIELKSDRGRVTPEQAAWHRAAAAMGAIVVVAKSVEEVMAVIEAAT